MNKLLAIGIAMSSWIGSAQDASANANSAWSMNAGGCVPTDVDVSLQGTHYFTVTGGMRVKHKGTDINDINLVCPVTALAAATNANLLVVYYANDGDGAGTSFSVTATLRSVAKWTGAYTSSMCTATSSNASTTWASSSCFFTGLLDLDANFYWVEINLHRASTAFTPEVNGVELTFAPL